MIICVLKSLRESPARSSFATLFKVTLFTTVIFSDEFSGKDSIIFRKVFNTAFNNKGFFSRAIFVAIFLYGLENSVYALKYYSKPLRFRYNSRDQEMSGSIHEDKHYHKDNNHEIGSGLKHHDKHHVNIAEDTHKGYKSYSEMDKKEKENVNKINHKNHFEEERGHAGEKHEEGEHYNHHEKGVKTVESAEFDENGKHQKGHNTKGEHNIFKKDEYEKKHDFYDEFHEGDSKETHGEQRQHHEMDNGDHHKLMHDIFENYEVSQNIPSQT